MNSFKAIVLMIIWTGIVGYILFMLGAHQKEVFTVPLNAVGIGIVLLVVHLVNLFIYFKIAGEKPFQWFK